jgi:hypothetical protein
MGNSYMPTDNSFDKFDSHNSSPDLGALELLRELPLIGGTINQSVVPLCTLTITDKYSENPKTQPSGLKDDYQSSADFDNYSDVVVETSDMEIDQNKDATPPPTRRVEAMFKMDDCVVIVSADAKSESRDNLKVFMGRPGDMREVPIKPGGILRARDGGSLLIGTEKGSLFLPTKNFYSPKPAEWIIPKTDKEERKTIRLHELNPNEYEIKEDKDRISVKFADKGFFAGLQSGTVLSPEQLGKKWDAAINQFLKTNDPKDLNEINADLLRAAKEALRGKSGAAAREALQDFNMAVNSHSKDPATEGKTPVVVLHNGSLRVEHVQVLDEKQMEVFRETFRRFRDEDDRQKVVNESNETFRASDNSKPGRLRYIPGGGYAVEFAPSSDPIAISKVKADSYSSESSGIVTKANADYKESLTKAPTELAKRENAEKLQALDLLESYSFVPFNSAAKGNLQHGLNVSVWKDAQRISQHQDLDRIRQTLAEVHKLGGVPAVRAYVGLVNKTLAAQGSKVEIEVSPELKDRNGGGVIRITDTKGRHIIEDRIPKHLTD